MAKPAYSAAEQEPLSHNLQGQRLGRKGRDTRERILAATERLLAGPADTAISLSAVAREASLAMTTLYLYFGDLTELLLAVLDPVMASSEEAYLAQLRTRWPDEALGGHCLAFVEAYHGFWLRHARILHLRNSFGDNGDERMRQHRIAAAQPVIELLARQMAPSAQAGLLATVLMTGLERVVTVSTDVNTVRLMTGDPTHHIHDLLKTEARVLELGLNDGRKKQKA